MGVIDLKNFVKEHTIVFKDVPAIGDAEDEPSGISWTIRPWRADQEFSIREAQQLGLKRLRARMKKTKLEAGEALSEEDGGPLTEEEETLLEEPEVMAEYWAPIVAAMVADPELDPEELRENYYGLLLRYVGQEAESFFLFGRRPEKMKDQAENRQTRRTQSR